MKSGSIASKAEEVLHLDYKEKDTIWLTRQDSLRKLVGILGVLLPILLFLFLWFDTGYSNPLESISHYYYTRVSGIFVITVSLLAIFLLVYKGEEPIDFYSSALAGIFALFVVLFPTSNITDICFDQDKPYSVTVLPENAFRYYFHYASAAVFLLSLAFMSLFLFTKSDKLAAQRTDGKKNRNRVYRTCGVIMVLALITIFAGFLHLINDEFYTSHHLTFWMESMAVESFGIAWLTKAEVFFKD
ncbi:MAG: hypothetical protein SH818_01495 [Saprospiraceae bacterium]|nr:hypothetical protein [Saprospiraceae bacterium]